MPQAELLKLLEGIGDGAIGMDCCVLPTKFPDIKLIQTTDFFYPLVDDPYAQGKIGCANVLSDLYSMGVVDCDTMLMLLAVSTDMNKSEREVVTKMMMNGFNDLAKEAGTKVTGGQTVMNPWPIIGGVASTVCKDEDIILPVNAKDGDLIVLTKPLGIQVAVNAHQWYFLSSREKWGAVSHIITFEEMMRAYTIAMKSMSRLNRTGARLMHKYGAHAATDVTGFGILGHGTNLAQNQKDPVNFIIHTLPIIRSMTAIDTHLKRFNLLVGRAAETSGGLLICLPADKAESFCKEIEEIDGQPAWIIGKVVKSQQSEGGAKNTCTILENPTVIEV